MFQSWLLCRKVSFRVLIVDSLDKGRSALSLKSQSIGR